MKLDEMPQPMLDAHAEVGKIRFQILAATARIMETHRYQVANDAFHAHLDVCSRCREQVFNLCPMGRPLLAAAGEATIGLATGKVR